MSKSLLLCEKTGSQFTESNGWAAMLNCCDKGSIFRSKTIQIIMDQINIFDTFIYSTKRVGYRFDPMKINVNGVDTFMSTLKFFENVWFSGCGLLVELFKCIPCFFFSFESKQLEGQWLSYCGIDTGLHKVIRLSPFVVFRIWLGIIGEHSF